MKETELMSHVDHTLLSPSCTFREIRALLDDAINFGAASVCIPPCYVKMAKEYAGDRMKIGTVIGFPNGYQASRVKAFEAKEAVADGADEIDMVINIGFLKAGDTDAVSREIALVREACPEKILKVIIETCLLTREEKIEMCRVVGESGADYIKTSTGFSTGGATREDVALFAQHVKAPLKIKAAGGIQSLEDAEAFLSLGADRLGTSRVLKLMKEKKEKSDEGSDAAY